MREKKLLINSILFFLGSLGKGVASVVIVFMASFYISPSDMGIYDLVISTMTLLQPIIIFQINDGIYRWLLENPNDKRNIIKSGFEVAYRNIFIANIAMMILVLYVNFQHKVLIAILLNLNCIYPLFQQITRGLKNHKVFAYSGLINGVSVLAISYVLMKYFDLGVEGFYIAQIIANIVGITYLAIVQRIEVFPWGGDKEKIKNYSGPMQKYSIMLVPNSVNQWIMKALDKYCILFFLSTYENGIYTVAHRFPDVLIMLNNMFYSAWVEQAIVEYKSEDRDVYFSKIYGMYYKAVISIVLVAMPITKYFINVFVGVEYKETYQYVPFLYIGVIFLGMSSFIGTGYLGTKHTEGILWTSLAGSLINSIINIVLMPYWGLQIAGISSVCAYFVMWIVRTWQTRKYFNILIKWKILIPLIMLTFVFALIVQLNNFILDIIFEFIAIVLAIILNKDIVKPIIYTIIRKKF